MTWRTRFVFAVLWMMALGLFSTPFAQQKGGVLSMTPDEFSGSDADAFQQKALRAYAEKRYEDALRAFADCLRARPGQSVVLYNMACCYGLLGAPDQAAAFLAAAWKAGFKDLATAEKDPDFDKVRSAPAFKARLDALRGEETKGGKALPVPALAAEVMRVVTPRGMDASRRYPLVIALHGAWGSAEDFAAHLGEPLAQKGFLFAAPQGQYATAQAEAGDIGHVWFRPGAGTIQNPDPLSRKLAEDYVERVLEEVARNYPVDRANVFLLGFSQGAFLAYSTGLKKPGLFRGVIPVGGWVNPGDYPRTPGPKLPPFLICHSPEDADLPIKEADAGAAFVKELGGKAEVFRYAGGHVMSQEVIRKIADWAAASLAPEKKP
jgi:phospholipase/carboxylesterase